ncbi:hypothetical protein LshimejAT787_0705010 [Lyophyllum shimeji]|uniref:Uncharacterized protein n=1 Tax=Lyophyllum shimeji TaxID=47721 RepID=A0A9P3PRF9_LYOSH|nr:hypothetical protein LshimejAT787_0705010 [Lyophyllum shimeji]
MVKYTGQAVLFPWNLVRFVLSDARMTGAMTAPLGSFSFACPCLVDDTQDFLSIHVYVLWKERRLRSRIYFPLQILINRLLPDVLQ